MHHTTMHYVVRMLHLSSLTLGFTVHPRVLPCSVPDKEASERRLQLAAELGGVARFGPFPADGWICIVQDPQGAFCGMYSREDEWDAVKNAEELQPADVSGIHD